MPNWIEETMKLRGKRDDIRRFIHEGIHGYDFLGEKESPTSNPKQSVISYFWKTYSRG